MTPTDLEQQRIKYVQVTNGLDFPFVDRHDGVPYTIQPGRTLSIPLDVAAHIFGFDGKNDRAAMMRYVTRRQGWNTPEYIAVNLETGRTKAEELFSRLKIEAVMYKLVPVEPQDPKRPVPADASADDDGEDAPIKRGPGRPPKPRTAEASA